MKKSIKLIFSLVVFLVFLGSCQKEEVSLLPPSISKENTSVMMKSVSGNSFFVSESILQYFVHYCQRQAGPASSPYYTNAEGIIPSSDATSACCPTSYMMAAACLAHYKDGSSSLYNATGIKLKGIIAGFKTFNTDWRSIVTARNYCNSTSYDGGWLTATYLLYSSSQRASAKTQLESWLSSNKFVLVPVSIATTYDIVNQGVLYQNSSSNPDLSSTSSSSNYLQTSGGSGHIILVIRIDKNDNSSEGGVVTYIDPLSVTRTTSNRKYVSYKRFLDSMMANNASYPMTSISLK